MARNIWPSADATAGLAQLLADRENPRLVSTKVIRQSETSRPPASPPARRLEDEIIGPGSVEVQEEVLHDQPS